MKTTIYDVAKEAGVSIATVSKVVNGTGKISEKTKKHVLEVMDRLHYQPSVVASALTGKKTHTIGLLVPDIANPFFSEVARALEDSAEEKGFNVIMCSTDNNDEKGKKYISLLLRKRVDGLIIATSFQDTTHIKKLVEKHIPVVLFSTDIPALSVDMVSVDDYKAAFQAMDYLLSLGHKRIGLIAEQTTSSKYRIQGYKDALEAAGVNVDENLIHYTEAATIQNGKQITKLLFEEKDRPTAIFACNDILAAGVMQGAKEEGIRIPTELSIIGFDNTILADICYPPLTTIAQPIQEMAEQTTSLLIQQIEHKDKPKQRILLVPELMIRESTTKMS
ncbi:LacI family DNA-binding transcriptional regulator [Bacillus cytotoxicus]|uniref:HTH-type transcriptional regulator DegA n=1 Tax=Bacillus cytotoxicus TaxID=580165 RepID=A0AAX2CH27_9BACI|nr:MULTISPECIES: LacI family DNA-binding transcriptional regulator [Bacillus cereus group]QTR69355.1 LacI family DNA-binding transcriptional regulator [Bacillus cytotoxicus]QTR78054.1 LacI family DNA-binding transcriptional regulator [Bacillus cytotoxicus]QTR82125.1 LacI family DNA-binding transcriptional regulator [Bacillus cytotoxicus]QTR85863.1 LacI family DNA-binding transcriptional regulator [Bacillus cytotoxicus]SCL92963.1 HTH-type transcriptional regulator DegA [Bacillus cytotoxicus]